jgi:predicted secreted protein
VGVVGLISVYVSLWMLSLLLALPFAYRKDEGEALVPGQADGAPSRFDGRATVIRATLLGTALFALLLLDEHFGWVTWQMLDVTGGV